MDAAFLEIVCGGIGQKVRNCGNDPQTQPKALNPEPYKP